jgi:glyoxylate carboligase
VTGGIIIAIITALLLPFMVLVGGFVICTVMGWSLWRHTEATHEGSELIDLNT